MNHSYLDCFLLHLKDNVNICNIHIVKMFVLCAVVVMNGLVGY